MKVFDFNRHLASREELQKDVQKTIDLIGSMDIPTMTKRINSIDDGNTGANMMLFNENAFYTAEDFEHFFASLNPRLTASYTLLFDFRRKNVHEYITMINASPVHAVKLHAYQQKIGEGEYGTILNALKGLERDKVIMLDTSYGSLDIFNYHPLKLAAFLARDLPHRIVLLHSGGAKALDAMLIAASNPNIYLDTSVSLEYYMGSSVEKDLMFAYKKIGADRVMYGTDLPFFDFSPEACIDVLEQYGFNDREIGQIMYDNAIGLLGL